MIGAIISFILGFACCWALSPMWEDKKCVACMEKQMQTAILPGAWALTIGEETWNVIPIVEAPPIGEEET